MGRGYGDEGGGGGYTDPSPAASTTTTTAAAVSTTACVSAFLDRNNETVAMFSARFDENLALVSTGVSC